MSIDTSIAGDPRSVGALAAWLGTTLHPALDHAVDTLREAPPEKGWTGHGADAFATWSASSATTAGRLVRHVERTADDLQAYAAALREAREQMAAVEKTAAVAGLQVHEHQIADPGAGPGRPAPLPSGPQGVKVSLETAARYGAAVQAFEAHQELVSAYREAERDAAKARAELDEVADRVQEGHDQLRSRGWMTNGLGILAGATGAAGDRPVVPHPAPIAPGTISTTPPPAP